jgi:hypothetical protein
MKISKNIREKIKDQIMNQTYNQIYSQVASRIWCQVLNQVSPKIFENFQLIVRMQVESETNVLFLQQTINKTI